MAAYALNTSLSVFACTTTIWAGGLGRRIGDVFPLR
jgi:hypothetical protein